jgi:hypothetical protein
MTKFRKSLLASAYMVAAIAIAFFTPAFAAPTIEISQDPENQTLTIDDAPDMKVIAISKDVVIKKRAKEVLAWGGNIIIEGSVEGDVATIGGSVVQKEGGFIGGDVIVIGGRYETLGPSPLRTAGKNTVMFGIFEEELRGFAKDPSQMLAPKVSVSFFVQRLLAAMFWFIITIAAATITPGAVSRGIASLKLSSLKITAVGAGGFIVTCIAVIVGLGFLPEYLSAVLGSMAFVLIMLAYGFGRVVLHVSIGKFVLDRMIPDRKYSEALSILVGVLFSIVLLSFPYVWPIALFGFFSIGTGLVLTARSTRSWKAS